MLATRLRVPGRMTESPKTRFPNTLAALGIFYGDIGTSPLCAFRACLADDAPLAINSVNVLGILSLILWSLILVASLKYLVFVMRADNDGEGGILALMSLASPRKLFRKGSQISKLTLLGLFGAALLYCDGVITPAISVLCAIEGVHVATDALERWVIPGHGHRISGDHLRRIFVDQPSRPFGLPAACFDRAYV